MFCGDTRTTRTRVRVLLLTQLGRITAYVLAGATVGAMGFVLVGWLNHAVAYRLLQWAGAVALMWIGLSTAGLLPALAGLDRGLAPISTRVARLATTLDRRSSAPFLMGLAWGAMPCAMVYGALFAAAMTGSAAGGALVMLGFGAGTLPALTITAFGIRSLVRVDRLPYLRAALGLAISGFGFATVFVPQASIGILCQ
jgi:sulfite exporter TauE/SafE